MRRRAGRLKRQIVLGMACARTAESDNLRFTCNVCGHAAKCPLRLLTREGNSCAYCGSTVRIRSVIHALSMELFGRSLVIADFPQRPDITGIGLSDWDGFALRLPEKLGYTNTFYHQAPFLDISADEAKSFGTFDFVICSDVFEHIAQPVAKSFENARHLLKPGGVMIFTVPYRAGETVEHYPELAKYSILSEGGEWVLDNETADGTKQRFSGLTFHGGPGTVIEMRIFGKDALARHFAEAGFASTTVHEEEQRHFGIVWNAYVPEDAPYRPLIYGLDTPPWAARVAKR